MFRSLFINRNVHPAATPVRLKPSVDISFAALVYFGATIFIGVAAMNSQTNLLFGVFGLMIGVLFVAGYISRFSLRRLEIRRLLPDVLVVGQQTTLVYAIVNRKRFWPSIAVAVSEIDGCEAFTRQPFAYLMHVAARLNTQIVVQFWPKRRGVHDLGSYQISTSFPFGFIKRAAIFQQKDMIVVLPALARVDSRFLSMCISAETSGSRMRPRRGGHDEFFGVKEYRGGENPRLIHWKRSARTGTLVIREMSQVAPPRLIILVDTCRNPGEAVAPAQPEVEKTIAMAASAASYALECGYPVGLCVWAGQWLYIPPHSGKRHRRDLLSTLAKLPANPNTPVTAGIDLLLPKLDVGTTLVVFTCGGDPTGISPRSRGRGRGRGSHSAHGQVIVLSSTDPAVSELFTFAPTVTFDHCMPVDQEVSGFIRQRQEGALHV